jgi:hypothetical protein
LPDFVNELPEQDTRLIGFGKPLLARTRTGAPNIEICAAEPIAICRLKSILSLAAIAIAEVCTAALPIVGYYHDDDEELRSAEARQGRNEPLGVICGPGQYRRLTPQW